MELENLYASLTDKIKEQLLFFANSEENIYIQNRAYDVQGFCKVFKDGLDSYRPGILFLDRFYFGKSCRNLTIPITDVSDEYLKKMKDIQNDISVMDADEFKLLSEEAQADHNEKVKRKLSELTDNAGEMQLMKTEDKEVPHYVNDLTGETIQVILLKDLNEEFINSLSTNTANFIIAYYIYCMAMSVAQNYEFEIIPVNYPDYIDLICNFKIKENE